MTIKNYILDIWQKYTATELKRSSSLLILAQIFNAGCTFGFWFICARTFTAADVGLASSIITFGAFLVTLANLGLANTVMRQLAHHKDKPSFALAILGLAVPASLIVSLLGLSFISNNTTKLNYIVSSKLLVIAMVVFVLASVLQVLAEAIGIALGRADLILKRTIASNIIKLLIPLTILGLGINSIILAYAGAAIIGSTYLLAHLYHPLFINRHSRPIFGLVWDERRFAIGNYAGSLTGALPSTLVPLVVLTQLGPETAAYFYIPLQIALFFNVLASSTSQALFAEGAKKQHDKPGQLIILRHAAIHLFKMLTIAVGGALILGWPVLWLYGKNYAANGYLLIILFGIASFFVAINWLGDTWLNIQKKSRLYFIMNTINSVLVIILTYSSAKYGLVAVGLGWVTAQALTAVVFLGLFRFEIAAIINHHRS